MKKTRCRMLAGAGLLVLASIAGPATMVGALTPSASVTTAIQGWESWIRLEWTTAPRA